MIESGSIDLWGRTARTRRLAPLLTLLCAAIPNPAVCQDANNHPGDVVVSEHFRFFAGGRDLPVTGNREAVISRLGASSTAAPDLGVSLTPGLEIGAGNTVQLSAPPPANRAAGLERSDVAKLITVRPVSYRGIPLAPGSDVMSVASATGQLLAVRERNLPQSVDGNAPTVDRNTAIRVALEAGRTHAMPPNAKAGEPHLEVFVDRSGKGRLAWRVPVSSPTLATPWARDIWVAAIADPVVLADRSTILDAENGHVTATVYSLTPFGSTMTVDLSEGFVNKTRGGGALVSMTGNDGRYSFGPGALPPGGTTTIDVGPSGPNVIIENANGNRFNVRATGAGDAPIDVLLNASTPEDLAQTTAFYALNRAHAFVADFLPPHALDRVLTRVNIDGKCNAFWMTSSSTLNFFRAGKVELSNNRVLDCPNTAYLDVAMHEYGHAVDTALGGMLDAGYSEGFGDALSILYTRQPCPARDFFGPGTCLRPTTDVVLWPLPDDTDDPHIVGQPYAGFVWSLVTLLQTAYSPDEAFEIARKLVLGAAAYNPSSVPDAVYGSFLVDDDDGDLMTCSPHFQFLATAAESRHIPHPSNCTPKPAVSAVTPTPDIGRTTSSSADTGKTIPDSGKTNPSNPTAVTKSDADKARDMLMGR